MNRLKKKFYQRSKNVEVVSLKAIQRANGIIIGMSKDEVANVAKGSPYKITADEINRIFSRSKIKR